MANHNVSHAAYPEFEKKQKLGVVLTLAGPAFMLLTGAVIAMSSVGDGIKLRAAAAPDLTKAHPTAIMATPDSSEATLAGRATP